MQSYTASPQQLMQALLTLCLPTPPILVLRHGIAVLVGIWVAFVAVAVLLVSMLSTQAAKSRIHCENAVDIHSLKPGLQEDLFMICHPHDWQWRDADNVARLVLSVRCIILHN